MSATSWQAGLYLAAILIPLLASGAILAAGRAWSGRVAGLVAIGAGAGSLGLSLVGFAAYYVASAGFTADIPTVWRVAADWATVEAGATRVAVPVGLDIDGLAAILFVVVAAVALAVEVYALEWMLDDPRQGRFFAEIALFAAAMLGLVGAGNLFLLFLCWELVGFCSYLLVGFWGDEEANARAATKAFVVNRAGDVGMLVALGLIWAYCGTVEFRELGGLYRYHDGRAAVVQGGGLARDVLGNLLVEPIDGRAACRFAPHIMATVERAIPYSVLVVAGLGLVLGAAAKSAQFPLHVWLPDAMAGPTPASALIHAATMVAAGVYLLARAFPILVPEVLLVVAYVGAGTLILAATVAMVQEDYKKVLAYSTISQLGFMMLALGVGGRSAGLFHLVTHAWFKATLFLGAGSVYAATHTYRMAALGGLYPRMRTTALVMLVATMAIAGVPLFSGFASKDAILAASLQFARVHKVHLLLFLAPAVGSALTAFYMFRMWFLIFAGAPRSGAVEGAAEGGRLVRWPMIALAVPSAAAGWSAVILPLGFEPVVERWLRYAEPIESVDPGGSRWWALGASILVGSVGVGLGVLYYGPWDAWKRLDARRAAERFGPAHRFLASGWHLDTLYRLAIVRPLARLARGLAALDRRALDAAVDGSARAVERLARLGGLFDRLVVDRLVALVAAAVYAAGEGGRRLQAGRLRGYLMVLATAVVGLFALLFAWVLVE